MNKEEIREILEYALNLESLADLLSEKQSKLISLSESGIDDTYLSIIDEASDDISALQDEISTCESYLDQYLYRFNELD